MSIPEGFEEDCQTMSIKALRRKYRRGHAKIKTWLRSVGIRTPMDARTGKRPMPENFVAMCQDMTAEQICREVKASAHTVSRWRKEAGITTQVRPIRVPIQIPQVSPAIARIGWTPPPIPPRDDSIAGTAADALRRRGWRICRARTLSAKADPDEWLVGTRRMKTWEMVGMAQARECVG